jgi:tRNA(Ile)-lysidine synthase
MGPHPAVAAVRLAVRQALARHARGGQPVLVACSGGADSVALAAAVAFEVQRSARPAGFVTVDHGLQEGSEQRARGVAVLGYELGFDPVEVVAVKVGTVGGPEGAARDARYAALSAATDSIGPDGEDALVLLGHTADDQAETVLLGLGRGSGIASLAGMRPLNGAYLRPFLGLRRADTRAACQALGLAVWDDPHNSDPRYRRVRVRSEVLPLLEDVLGGGVTEALARTAAQLQEAEDALRRAAADLLGQQPDAGLTVAIIEAAPAAVRSRAIMSWAQSHGVRGLTAVHLAELNGLVTRWRGQGPIDLPDGFRVTRTSGTLKVIAPVTYISAGSPPKNQE